VVEISMPYYDMEQKLREFNEQGYVVFEQLFDHEVLDGIYPEYMRLYKKVLAREQSMKGTYTVQQGDTFGDKVQVVTPMGKEIQVMIPETASPGDVLDVFDETSHKSDSPDSMRSPTDEDLFDNGHGRCLPSNRYNLTLPWTKPFADPHIYENPTILEFLQRYWGDDEFSLTTLYVNSPAPGSTFQQWHRDGGPDFYDHKTLLEDPPTDGVPHGRTRAVGLKFALVDTNMENGAIQIVPGTHKMDDYGFDRHDYNQLLLDGTFHDIVKMEQGHVQPLTPMHHVLKKGDAWIQDPRIFHRGTANHSEEPRPEFQISYRSKKSPSPYRGLFVNNGFARPFTPRELAGLELSERGEKLVGHARPENYVADAIVPPERKHKETMASGYQGLAESEDGLVSKMTIDGDGFTKYETVASASSSKL
jgi:hypothetical protein